MDPPNQILYSDTVIKALAELHRIELSILNLWKQLPQIAVGPDIEALHSLEKCNCPTNQDTIIHSKCRHCFTEWCVTVDNQEWCPNPNCSNGIKGCHFKPYNEHYDWIQCIICLQWFKTPKILDAHPCSRLIE
jgi:hypothetical protein